MHRLDVHSSSHIRERSTSFHSRQHSHGHVLVLGKDGVVGLEGVLLEVLGSVLGRHLDVELAVSGQSLELEVELGSVSRWHQASGEVHLASNEGLDSHGHPHEPHAPH